jgi:hypothetical protein
MSMRLVSATRYAASAAALAAMGFFAVGASAPAQGQAGLVQDGKAGFVVADISFAFSHAASETGACPQGLTSNASLAGLFGGAGGQANRPQGQQAQGQEAQGQQAQQQGELNQAQQQAFRRLLADIDRNPCLNPQAAGPDPNFRPVTGRNVAITGGIDLDGQDSRANGRPAPGTCAHDDFRTFDGVRGVDNQFFRVVGCTNGYQPGGQANGFAIEMLTGAWGILIALNGVDDLRNDNEVEVGIYANADPIQLSPTREPLANATYAADQDPRFRATTRGRIVNGVLTTEPVDVRFHTITNGMYLERPLRDARLRMTVTSDGGLEGVMAGYTPVEELYDFTIGYRNARTAAGEPAPVQIRAISALGRAGTLGYSCQGMYHAFHEYADGHRDPETGRCTSISTQYHVRAIPAFVVETQTRSANEDLESGR